MPVYTFSNAAPIDFDYLSTDSDFRVSYAAKPYPSRIRVFDLPNDICNISIGLYGLKTDYLNNVSIILVAPNGINNLVLMNAVNSSVKQPSVDISIVDHSLPMPKSEALENQKFYQATSYSPFLFPPPIPIPPAGAPYNEPQPIARNNLTSCFISSAIDLDGMWSLYVFMSGTEIVPVTISGGWSISFYTKYHKDITKVTNDTTKDIKGYEQGSLSDVDHK